jgi:hypothetical protein
MCLPLGTTSESTMLAQDLVVMHEQQAEQRSESSTSTARC